MTKIKYVFKIFIIGFFLILPESSLRGAVICRISTFPPIPCTSGDCDDVIDCAMETQRDALEARLDDLINTIKANTKQTEHQTKIIEQEVLAYTRLLKRIYQESLSLKEARHLSKKIKDSEALGTSIDTIKKGI